MKNHKLSDVQAKRVALERSITDLLREFENETGVHVVMIQIGRVRNVDLTRKTVKETVTIAKVIIVL